MYMFVLCTLCTVKLCVYIHIYIYCDSYEHGFEVFSRFCLESSEMLVNHDPWEL